MKQNMPDVSFERSMNHNYMILSRCDFFGGESTKSSDYRTRMLLENRIPGLLPVTHRLINGESRYYYEINSLQSLDRLYNKNEIGYNELKSLLSGCVSLFDKLEEYLLDGTQIIIKPELIYINVEKMDPYFVCYPDYAGDVRLSFMGFIDELLTKIDHTDEQAVMLGYQVYRYTRNPNYVISEIRQMMEHRIEKAAGSEENIQKNSFVSNKEFPVNKDLGAAGSIMDKRFHTEKPAGGSSFLPYGNAYDDGDEEIERPNRKSKKTGNLFGGICCLFISICAGSVILCDRFFRTFQLDADNELYLYGAMAMAVMAAVLFFSCCIKQRKQNQAIEMLSSGNEGLDDCAEHYLPETEIDSDDNKNVYFRKSEYDKIDCSENKINGTGCDESSDYCQKMLFQSCGETVCLGNSIVEERRLYGRVNGREVNISLDKLPITVGKLANVSDFVINDDAVSKMHARFEEREGRVYVCDLNSTNGTVRNGVLLEVNQSALLEPGDRIRFGKTSFTYC